MLNLRFNTCADDDSYLISNSLRTHQPILKWGLQPNPGLPSIWNPKQIRMIRARNVGGEIPIGRYRETLRVAVQKGELRPAAVQVRMHEGPRTDCRKIL